VARTANAEKSPRVSKNELSQRNMALIMLLVRLGGKPQHGQTRHRPMG
jgi:hypothetical protein